MENKFGQDITGYPFDKSHKFAAEERVALNHLMGGSAGIVRGVGADGTVTGNLLTITVPPVLIFAMGAIYRSNSSIVLNVLPNSSGTIIARIDLSQSNDSVGTPDDGSYQYLLNQIRIMSIDTAPVKENILLTGTRYDVVMATWTTDATHVSVHDAREYAQSGRNFMASLGTCTLALAGNTITQPVNNRAPNGGGLWSALQGGQKIMPDGDMATLPPLYDKNAIKIELVGTGPSFKITNLIGNDIFIKSQAFVSVASTGSQPLAKFNATIQFANKSITSNTDIGGTGFDNGTPTFKMHEMSWSLYQQSSLGGANRQVGPSTGFVLKAHQATYVHALMAPYGKPLSRTWNMYGNLEFFRLN